MKLLFTCLLLCALIIPCVCPGQNTLPQQESEFPQINWKEKDSGIQFQSQLRPLRQISGAPEAFYSYFWEFGDGSFSFNEEPVHTYAQPGEYQVRLYATNNYDDGKAPPTRPRTVKTRSTKAYAVNDPSAGFFKDKQQLQLKVNSQPKPGEEMVCMIGYRNNGLQEAAMKSGTLILFYNDKQFKNKNFGLADLRKYHGEQDTGVSDLLAKVAARNTSLVYAFNQIAAHGPNPGFEMTSERSESARQLLMQKRLLFSDLNVLHYDHLDAGTERFVFTVLNTTPEMLRDTTATVTISALLIPDDPTAPILENNLELQIVASHDPNRMMLGNRKLNYRFLGNQKMQKYQVHFQNTGKGPAKKIDIGVRVAPTMDPYSLEVKEIYPNCVPCKSAAPGQSCLDTLITKDSIHFVFRNVYLPGMRQQGVSSKDSTKGFVEYRLRLKEKPPKTPFWSQAAIVFDKNTPVYTNKMRTRFMRGISPTLIAGYQKMLNSRPNGTSPVMIGVAIAPYAPYRAYLQAEAYLGIYSKWTNTSLTRLPFPRDTLFNGKQYVVTHEGNSSTTQLLSLDIVPIEGRKNLADWLGVGTGLWLKMNLSERMRIEKQQRLSPAGVPGDDSFVEVTSDIARQTRHFSTINPAAFADVNIGKARVGPALGIRYLHYFSPDQSALMFYAIWRL